MEENNQNTNTPPVQNSSSEQIATPPPPPKPKFKLPIVIAGIVLLLVIGTASAVFLFVSKPKQTACTVEAKICPDGTSVGRTGPNCIFAPCPTKPIPTPDETANWKTYINSNLRFSIKLPQEFKEEDLRIFYKGEKLNQSDIGVVDPYPHPMIYFDDRLNSNYKTAQDACSAGLCKNFASKKIILDNQEGVEVNSREFTAVVYLFNPTNSIALTTSLIADKHPINDQRTIEQQNRDFTLLKQILSTFRFIN